MFCTSYSLRVAAIFINLANKFSQHFNLTCEKLNHAYSNQTLSISIQPVCIHILPIKMALSMEALPRSAGHVIQPVTTVRISRCKLVVFALAAGAQVNKAQPLSAALQ